MRKTVLHDLHARLGARFVDFGGFEMPIRYGSIIAEHHAVRQAAGLFDLGHMARFIIRGEDAVRLTGRLVTNEVAALDLFGAHYSPMCLEDGGILDDVIYYRLEDHILLVANASNRDAVFDWLERHRGGFEVELEDASERMAMIALQGPHAERILNPLCDDDLEDVAYYCILPTRVDGIAMWLARTGYTGEDGFELYLPADSAVVMWETLSQAGEELGVVPCGLGARDTLRTEAAMPLYGHELSRTINPLEAGLGIFVKLDKPGGFVGRDALAQVKADKPARKLICFELEGRRAARQGDTLVDEAGEEVGEVTSGAFSPTLERPIGMGYVRRGAIKTRRGSPVVARVRGNDIAGTIVKRPFYKREKR